MKHSNILIVLLLTLLFISCARVDSVSFEPSITVIATSTENRSTEGDIVATSTILATNVKPNASSTPMPSDGKKTPTTANKPITNATSKGDIDKLERIFIWDAPVYGYLDPNSNNTFPHVLSPLDTNSASPGNAKTIAFSSFSGQVAYLIQKGQDPSELWVASLDLTETSIAWIDYENWLGISSKFDAVNIRWGPGDQFIILETDKDKYVEGEYYGVLFSFIDQSIVQLSGKCDHITFSLASDKWALGCPFVSEDDLTGKILLEQDGNKQTMSLYPDDAVKVKDWAFSPSGSSVLYVTDDNKLIVLDSNKNARELPIGYSPPRFDVVMRVLQWSKDGTRFLIYGDDKRGGICPTTIGTQLPCWMVIEESTLEVIWEPEKNVISNFDATLSPNGERIVLFYIDMPMRYSIVAQVNGSGYEFIYDWVVSAVCWDGN